MLEASQEYRATFTSMGEEGLKYVAHFKVDSTGRLNKPVDYDWDIVSIFLEFLELFYENTTNFFGSLYFSSNDFYQHISELKEKLDEMCESENALLTSMVGVIKIKYQKY